MKPRDFLEFVRWNDEMVERYDPDHYHTSSALPIRVTERLRVRAIRRLLDAGPATRVLEVGCGAGNVLDEMPGRRYGIDLSQVLLGKAHRRLGRGATLLRGDAARLPLADASFDRIYCSEVLEHVLEPEAVVHEMRRVLAPSGHAVVSVPNEELINQVKALAFRLPFGRRFLGAEEREGYRVSEKMDEDWHLHHFGRERLEQAVRGAFTVEAWVGVPHRLLPLRWVARLGRAP